MLAELFAWMTTPCPAAARRLGYLRESIAIEARFRRHAERWRPHLEKSKAVIEEAVSKASHRRRAVVLGSGPLFDIPVEVLADAFDVVELVDIVHPKRARQIAAGFANVELKTSDVSGAAAALAALPRNAVTAPLLVAPPSLMPDTDLVVSANLLSQLPDIPEIVLKKRSRLPETARKDFAHRIATDHFNWLRGLDALVCLITDTERQYVAPYGTPFPAWVLLHGVDLAEYEGMTWHWDIAPAGESHPEYAVRMQVFGTPDLAGAPNG